MVADYHTRFSFEITGLTRARHVRRADVPADVAADRASAIEGTATSLCNERLASVVAHGAP
jgi:hypothetical protein